MFLIFLAALLLGAYLAPAVALMPRAVFDSRLAFALPAVSILLVTLTARLLKNVDLFLPPITLGITLLVSLVAAVRLASVWGSAPRHWPPLHVGLYLFALFAVLPIAVIQAHNGFSTNDEIYSWNLWALEHFFGEPVDPTYTRAPYPQSFSYLIAWCYQLLGSINLQLPVKAAFAFLSASAVVAIAMTGPDQPPRAVIARLLLITFALYVADVYEVLGTGLAETLMVPVLVVSVALYLAWSLRGGTVLLGLCTAIGLLAALSKQPALLWLMVALPILVLAEYYRQRRPLVQLWPLAVCWLGGGLWLLTEGWGFQDNSGVINASREGRDLLEQLVHAGNEQLIKKPAFALLLLGSAVTTHLARRGRGLFWLLLIPSLLAWLLWGAYNTRLGTHVILLATVLIAFSNFGFAASARTTSAAPLGRHLQLTLGILCLAAAIYSALEFPKQLDKRTGPFSYYDAPQNIIRKFFGDAADPVLAIFRTERVLWVPSAYVYGILFKHNPLARSDNRSEDASRVRHDLLASSATLAVDDGHLAIHGNNTKALRALIASASCGGAFQLITVSPEAYEYVLYEVDLNRLEACMP